MFSKRGLCGSSTLQATTGGYGLPLKGLGGLGFGLRVKGVYNGGQGFGVNAFSSACRAWRLESSKLRCVPCMYCVRLLCNHIG